ncbi:hypothetical protein REJC140_02140 [Pseudorhizobium endolithicum]|uniref:Glycosyltransferase RgtA/B/C/D-like domain-containing protein n=1 Tax=Pseudorhizobium endolithicum TaxID=1191678 RepID=A0ABN7JYM5_9HYPH|nr:hypothetical protein [Pseudorhizobium endolithicum]CAD7054339.1 hypothetical protein REJC140_02140 [Pseudorhizobium endolithicum]
MTGAVGGYLRSNATATGLLTIALVCAAMLALPGRTVTAAFTNDVLIFLDGAHRIAWGQLPNRDFHTALGPLVFYIPAVGYFLSGNFGAAMPVGMAALLVALLAPTIRILQSRLRTPIAVALGGFLIVILAAPTNLGSPVSLLSFAMFYNRIGWVALGLLLVMYVKPRKATPAGDLADAAAAAVLLLLQFYTKATYALVSLAFLLFMLSDRHQRNWVVGSLLLAVAGAAVVEFAWRGSWQYIEDLTAAARVSGGRSLIALVRSALHNLADLTVFAIAVSVMLWQTRNVRDLLFYGFCAVSGILILNQNAHGWGIISLYFGAAVATESACRLRSRGIGNGAPETLGGTGMPLLLAFLLLPPIVHHASVLTLHARLAMINAGTPLGLPKLEDFRLVAPGASPGAFMNRYHESIADGARLLQSLSPQAERVVVLDFVNPFSAGLGLRPPNGDSAWMHWGRNINGEWHLAPETLFADAEIVMVPKVGINSIPLQQIYGPFISGKFILLKESDTWIVYRKRETGGAAR